MKHRRIGQSLRASSATAAPGIAAEGVYAALVAAQRNAGDVPLCLALEKLAGDTGQNKFRHAASILRGSVLGRSIDDGAALLRIAAFPPARRRDAVGLVARQLAGAGASSARLEAVARRLRRKRREKLKRTMGSIRCLDPVDRRHE